MDVLILYLSSCASPSECCGFDRGWCSLGVGCVERNCDGHSLYRRFGVRVHEVYDYGGLVCWAEAGCCSGLGWQRD